MGPSPTCAWLSGLSGRAAAKCAIGWWARDGSASATSGCLTARPAIFSCARTARSPRARTPIYARNMRAKQVYSISQKLKLGVQVSNTHPLKRELPNQFGADKVAFTEQERWRMEVCDHSACPRCKAAKGEFCTLKNGSLALRCHPERSRKFVAHLQAEYRRAPAIRGST
jgi:hypothetical protein